MISVCMIVKDEENNLERCLSKIPSFIDDIVIVDTGSKDRTIEVARKYTSKVLNFQWINDFAAARNFSLEQANNDWVLVLDADEIITSYDKDAIFKFILNNDEKVVARIKRINTFSDVMGNKRYIERVNRLFNKKHYKYDGIIHEQVVNKNSHNNTKYETKEIEITAEHIGYEKEVLEKTNKIQRNADLLKKAINQNPIDPYLLYQLGKTYFMAKDYKNAYDNFVKGISLIDNYSYEYTIDLIESYGYTLIYLGFYEEALKLEKYKTYYGSMADFNFLLGLIYMNNAMFELAVKEFLLCTEMNNERIEGVSSFLAFYNIGVIFECLGHETEAVQYYLQCGDYPLALDRYNNIINRY